MNLSKVEELSQAEHSGFLADWADGSDQVLIALSGMAEKYRPQVGFQLYGLTRNWPVHRIYMRDVFRSWYHHGHPSISNNIDETADHILTLLAERGVRRVVTCGISAGGYGALLLGWLLAADEVHAVTPQTYLDTDNRLKNDDFLGDDFMEEMYLNERSRIDYFDLRPLIESTPDTETKYHIYYCDKHRIDTCHAQHLQGVSGVELHNYESGAHRLSMHMARSGELERVLKQALALS